MIESGQRLKLLWFSHHCPSFEAFGKVYETLFAKPAYGGGGEHSKSTTRNKTGAAGAKGNGVRRIRGISAERSANHATLTT